MAAVDPLVLLVQAEAQVLVGAQSRDGWKCLLERRRHAAGGSPRGRQAAYPQGKPLWDERHGGQIHGLHDGFGDFFVAHFAAGQFINGVSKVEGFFPSLSEHVGIAVRVRSHQRRPIVAQFTRPFHSTSEHHATDKEGKDQRPAHGWGQDAKQTVEPAEISTLASSSRDDTVPSWAEIQLETCGAPFDIISGYRRTTTSTVSPTARLLTLAGSMAIDQSFRSKPSLFNNTAETSPLRANYRRFEEQGFRYARRFEKYFAGWFR